MRKFPFVVFTILLAVSSCSGNAAPYSSDLRGDMEEGASSYFEAMVRRDGEDLVNELRFGESELVFFGSAVCSHCEEIEEALCRAIARTGLFVSLVYIESSFDVQDPTSDYSIVRSYLQETYEEEDVGRFTPWLYYVAPDGITSILSGTGNDTSEDYYYRLLKNNFGSTSVTRFSSPSSLDEEVLSVLIDSSDESAYASYLVTIKKGAERTGKPVSTYDYAALKEEDPLAFCGDFELEQFENAVRVDGVTYSFPSLEASAAVEGYFA